MRRPVADVWEIRGYSRAEVAAWTALDVVTFMANELEARAYRSDIVAKCADTRAAVAELIEADREYDAAHKAYIDYLRSDSDARPESGVKLQERFNAADARRAAALARVGGAS